MLPRRHFRPLVPRFYYNMLHKSFSFTKIVQKVDQRYRSEEFIQLFRPNPLSSSLPRTFCFIQINMH